MNTRERFEKVRQEQRNRFSLRTRLTAFVTLEMLICVLLDYGLDQLLQHETGIKTEVAADAISCVAAGTGASLTDIEYYDNMYNSRDRKNIVQI